MQTPFPSPDVNQILHAWSAPRFLGLKIQKVIGSCGGVEILAFPLTRHIVYTTACCYHTSRDHPSNKAKQLSFISVTQVSL